MKPIYIQMGIMALSAYGLYSSGMMYSGLGDYKALMMLQRYQSKKSWKERMLENVSRIVPPPNWYLGDWISAEAGEDRERLWASQILRTISWISVLTLMLFLKFGFLSFLTLLLGVTDIFNSHFVSRHLSREREELLLRELPQLIQYIRHAYLTGGDLLSTLEKYRRICREPFLSEIEKLLMDMRTGNQQLALIRFNSRFDQPLLNALINGLSKMEQGGDQETFFELISKEVQNKLNSLTMEKLRARPRTIKLCSLGVICCFILLLAYPALMHILQSIKIFS